MTFILQLYTTKVNYITENSIKGSLILSIKYDKYLLNSCNFINNFAEEIKFIAKYDERVISYCGAAGFLLE